MELHPSARPKQTSSNGVSGGLLSYTHVTRLVADAGDRPAYGTPDSPLDAALWRNAARSSRWYRAGGLPIRRSHPNIDIFMDRRGSHEPPCCMPIRHYASM